MKRLAVYAAAVCAVVALADLAWHLRDLWFAMAAAWALAASTRAPVAALRERGVSRGVALVVTYLGALAVVVAAAAVIGGPLLDELSRGADWLSTSYERLLGRWAQGGTTLRNVAATLPTPRFLLQALRQMRPADLASSALVAGAALVGLTVKLVVLLVLAIYWSLYQDAAIDRVLRLVPAARRTHVRRVLWTIESGVGRLMQSEGTKTVLTVGVLAVAFRLLGLDLPTVPAVLIAVVRVVPFAGFGLGVVTAALAGSGHGAAVMITTAVFTALWLPVLDRLLMPRLLAVRTYHPVLVVVVVVALAPLYGWAGLIAAPVVAAALQLLLESTVFAPARVRPVDTVARLVQRHQALHRRIAEAPEPLSTEVTDLLHRLDRLVAELHPPEKPAHDEHAA